MNIHFYKVVSWILVIVLLLPSSVLAKDSIEEILEMDTKPIITDQLFRDVGNHWAANAIYNMTQYGIINGYDDSTFKPENSISREEFAALLAKSFSLEWNTGKRVSSYADIQPDRWSAPYIESIFGIYPDSNSEKELKFQPSKPVTREEFTATLVRVTGVAGPEKTGSAVLDSTFRDAGQIAMEYRNDIATAVELKLIQGQANRMFAPKASISRAEVASIMYRAILLSDEKSELDQQINLPDQVTKDVFEVTGKVEAGAEVVLNGQKLNVINGVLQTKFRVTNEGVYNIVIAVRPLSGKVHFIRRKLVYERAVPKISLYSFSETATKNKINLAGKVSYEGSSILPELFINEEKVNVLIAGDFNKDVNLEEGVNLFRLKAIGSDGRIMEVTKQILFNPPVPVLNIDTLPERTKLKTITVTGKVKDANDEAVEVYVNWQKVKVDTLGSFSFQLDLTPGKNTIEFTAQNKYDKLSKIVKTIELTSEK